MKIDPDAVRRILQRLTRAGVALDQAESTLLDLLDLRSLSRGHVRKCGILASRIEQIADEMLGILPPPKFRRPKLLGTRSAIPGSGLRESNNEKAKAK